MKRILLLYVACFWEVSPAWATGGFACEAKDKNLDFAVSATTGRGMGSPIVGSEAKAELMLKGTPKELQKLDLSQALVHHWLDYPDLKLHYYSETTGAAPFASAELIIRTKGVEGDEIVYEGDYQLRVYLAEPPAGVADENGNITATGKVTCTGE
jgi:hypothetical protein